MLREDTPNSQQVSSQTDRTQSETWIDLYKHHFDLFLKGYVVQLAIVGAVAGYVFRPGTDETTRAFLLGFVMLVTAISAAAWINGLVWRRRILRHLARKVGEQAADDLVFAAKGTLCLGVTGSVVIFLGALAALLGYF